MKLSSLLLKAAVICGLTTTAIATVPSAIAQVGMSPLFIESEASRGRAQGVLTLINSSDESMRVRLYAEPFTFNQDGFVSLPADEKDLSPYLQFSPREVVIPARSDQRVRLLGTFPPGLADGEYKAVVFAEELEPSSTDSNGVAIKARVGTTVYMRQGQLSAELTNINAIPSEQSIDLIVENMGLATARPQVKWTLHRDGEEIAEGEEVAHTVVAKSSRKVPLPLSEALPTGSYTLSGKLIWTTLEEDYSQPFELPVVVP